MVGGNSLAATQNNSNNSNNNWNSNQSNNDSNSNENSNVTNKNANLNNPNYYNLHNSNSNLNTAKNNSANQNTNNSNNNSEKSEEQLFNDIEENFNNASNSDFFEETKSKFSGKLPHPKAASRWRTRELIMTSQITMQDEIRTCKNELSALTTNALSPETMLTSRNILTQAIIENVEAYHWCFYLTMLDLDNRLDAADINMNFSEKYALFTQGMKSQWILARALDAALSSKRYFGYLRRRYIEISQGHFGKPLEVISAPLGDMDRTPPSLIPKPAGFYSE